MKLTRLFIKWKFSGVINLILINFLLLLVLLTVTDLFLGDWRNSSPITVYNTLTHHDYAPSLITNRILGKIDGGEQVPIYVNASSIRVGKASEINKTTDVFQYDIINLGDSFMQADEIPFGKLLSVVMSKKTGKTALQVGYSSWAPLNMYNWLSSQQIKKGVHINIFAMMNDFTPHYWASNYSYYVRYSKLVGDKRLFIIPEKKEETLWEKLKKRSFYLSKIYKIKNNLKTNYKVMNHKNIPQIVGLFNKVNTDLGVLEEAKRKCGIPLLAKDYIYLSFDSSCWPKPILDSVDNAILYLNKIIKQVKEGGGTITIYLIPGGWSFPGECLAGKQMPDYNFAPETIITSMGLADYLSLRIKTKLVPLEPIIKDLKHGDDQKWYFSQDGHWTAHAHQKLGEWIAKEFGEVASTMVDPKK